MTQDHTLWEILRQPNIDLWRQKGDWLISNHGLVNVIVHPDYVRSAARLDLYAQFLSYLRERVDGRGGWHALPCDVASWWRARAQMRCTDEHAGPRIVHDETAGQWSQRATVAWVSERDGTMKIDV
jgi:hypothetical protein